MSIDRDKYRFVPLNSFYKKVMQDEHGALNPLTSYDKRYKIRILDENISNSENKMEKDYFTPKEASEILNVSCSLIYKYVARRKIGCVRVGSSIKIRQIDIDRFVKDNEYLPEDNSITEIN
jgi:excisionase family DNA binding protein